MRTFTVYFLDPRHACLAPDALALELTAEDAISMGLELGFDVILMGDDGLPAFRLSVLSAAVETASHPGRPIPEPAALSPTVLARVD